MCRRRGTYQRSTNMQTQDTSSNGGPRLSRRQFIYASAAASTGLLAYSFTHSAFGQATPPKDWPAKHTDVVPEDTYPYWPAYQMVPLEQVRPQPWRAEDHVIEGWDWSLPPHIEPAPNSAMGLHRIFHHGGPNMDQIIDFEDKVHFPSTPVTHHWVFWRDIEPEEGVYDWEWIREVIAETKRRGSDSLLRIMCYSTGDRGAPRWLQQYNIKEITYDKANSPAQRGKVNYDPMDPTFHEHWKRLVQSLKASGIPRMEALCGFYVGYASRTYGDEGIGPHDMDYADEPPLIKERLDLVADAFRGIEHKVYMGGPSRYGLKLGFGVRRGFVEKYLYEIPSYAIGQYIDAQNHLRVNEQAPVIANQSFNGEENEEYDPKWATERYEFRFGKTTASFPYRYMISNLRALQMRCTQLMDDETLIPELLPFLAQELGRTAEDTPDVWCFLSEFYLRPNYYIYRIESEAEGPPVQFHVGDREKQYGLPTKNFERWLYQREWPGYETVPSVRITQPPNMWMTHRTKKFDYISRTASKIGFEIDSRFVDRIDNGCVVKVTYIDLQTGKLALKYPTGSGNDQRSVTLRGDGELRTATFLLNDADFGEDRHLELQGKGNEITVSFVRVVRKC
jgi:hypothetical protein